MDVVNDILNEIVRKQREHTEKTLVEIVEKYDFMVCSTELMNQLEEMLPEGAHIAYSPYIGDTASIYIIKKFDVMDLLNEALEKERDTAEDLEWGTMEESEAEDDIVDRPKCMYCEYATLKSTDPPCYPCFCTTNRPNFKPNESCKKSYSWRKEFDE